MATNVSYPGVYIQEVPSGVRTIAGVPTSVAAFIGSAARGPVNSPVQIFSFADFERQFGGLVRNSDLSYAVSQFFLNGGGTAWIVRVTGGGVAAAVNLEDKLDGSGIVVLTATAIAVGEWGNNLSIVVDYDTTDPATLFNLTVLETQNQNGQDQVVRSEVHRNLSMAPSSSAYALSVVNAASNLVRLSSAAPITADRPAATGTGNVAAYELGNTTDSLAQSGGVAGTDAPPLAANFQGSQSAKTGIYALEDVDLFNILVLPNQVDPTVQAEAIAYAEARRAFVLLDMPDIDDTLAEATAWLTTNAGLRHKNAAAYFPRIHLADPLENNRVRAFANSGAIAGLYARTDGERGVWKAPAGTDAVLRGVRGLDYVLTDGENGVINPLGLNAIRSSPAFGPIAWGARTLVGSDMLASEWKYIPVRRLALFLEESLYRGTQWVVFEPNDEPLWSQIRLNVGAFMHTLFRQGAFQGKTPKDAYLVQCDSTTTTQDDINLGIVNIIVGFAPLKPAEFVIIKLQQLAGQAGAGA